MATGDEAKPSVPQGRVTVLGCDGSYPGPGGAASGYLVEAARVSVWLDAGAGTFAALQLVSDPGRIDAVVLSHEHPDHWSDIDAYAVWLRERAGRDVGTSRPPVPVFAPPGLRSRSYFADEPLLAWHEVEPSQRTILRAGAGPDVLSGGGHASGPSMVLSFCATDHGPPTLAVRFDAGHVGWVSYAPAARRSLAYSADTGPGWSVEELGPGVETFLCEATYTAAEEGSARHLSGRQAAGMARAAGVARLVLTHRRPSVPRAPLRAEAEDAFGGPVEQAAPGAAFEW